MILYLGTYSHPQSDLIFRNGGSISIGMKGNWFGSEWEDQLGQGPHKFTQLKSLLIYKVWRLIEWKLFYIFCWSGFESSSDNTCVYGQGVMMLDWSAEITPEVPQCVSLHLKTFSVFNFSCLQSEFTIIKFIMKNAAVLSSLIIMTCNYLSDEDERLHLVETLSSYPKCSQNCSIFVDNSAGDSLTSVNERLVSEKDFSYYFPVSKFQWHWSCSVLKFHSVLKHF